MKGWNVRIFVVWSAALVAIVALHRGDGDAYSSRIALARLVGWQAAVALVLALCVNPVSRFVKKLPEPAKLRRALGVAAASAAVIHALIAVSSSPLTLAQQLEDPHLRFGFGALIVLVLMGITSFPRVVAWLHLRSWKELHRLVYVAWICAVLHAFLSPYAWLPGVMGVVVVVTIASLHKLWPRRARAAKA